MEQYVSCVTTYLDSGSVLMENVSLPEGLLSHVYLSPGGVSALCASSEAPARLYESLRDTLGVTVLRLYVGDEGRYDPFERLVQSLPDGSEQRDKEISQQLSGAGIAYTADRISRMCDQLRRADAYHRGFYTDDEGSVFLWRHGRFQRASERDPEQQFMLTLYGGFLGLHRFAIGKVFTGLLYLCTCGIFLVGWLLDLLQLFLGIQRDRHKALILPLQNRRHKLLRLFPALAAGAIALVIYLQFLAGATELAAEMSAESGIAEGIANALVQLFPELSESP